MGESGMPRVLSVSTCSCFLVPLQHSGHRDTDAEELRNPIVISRCCRSAVTPLKLTVTSVEVKRGLGPEDQRGISSFQTHPQQARV